MLWKGVKTHSWLKLKANKTKLKLKETKVSVDTQAAAEDGLQRSQRTRKLTEKGQELHDDKSKRLQHRFTSTYDTWKAVAEEAKRALDGPPGGELLQDHMTKIHCASKDVKQAYEELLLVMERPAAE